MYCRKEFRAEFQVGTLQNHAQTGLDLRDTVMENSLQFYH